MWVVTVSDLLKWSVYLFSHFGEYLRNSKHKSTSARVFCQAEGLLFSRGGSSCLYFFKLNVQSNCNYERQAVFFFVYFIFFFSNSSQAFLATLTDWTWDFLFCFMKCGTFFGGTARLFINVSMVFSLHLITRSQKSTKMDEFELSGCTKLRYLHDWCCLALLSSFIWLFGINSAVCSLFWNFCFVYIFLKWFFFVIYFSLLLATCFFFSEEAL